MMTDRPSVKAIQARLQVYEDAVRGEGELAYLWADKKHRLVLDLINEMRAELAALTGVGTAPDVVEEIAAFVQGNTPYLQGIGNVGVSMAAHIRKKWGRAASAEPATLVDTSWKRPDSRSRMEQIADELDGAAEPPEVKK